MVRGASERLNQQQEHMCFMLSYIHIERVQIFLGLVPALCFIMMIAERRTEERGGLTHKFLARRTLKVNLMGWKLRVQDVGLTKAFGRDCRTSVASIEDFGFVG